MIWTAHEINAMRAQEAKDLALELQDRLVKKEKAPISAGEVQLRELEYQLKLQEAATEDARQQEQHQERLRQLELKIQEEKTRQAEAEERAGKVREEQAQLVQRVDQAKESLSIQLEKATRENHVKIEQLETNYNEKSEKLKKEYDEAQQRRQELREEIESLSELKETAEEIKRLREEIDSRRAENQHELVQLDEQFRTVEFERVQKINAIKREQEVEISELETQHKKSVTQSNQQAAKDILIKIGMIPLKKTEWEKMKKELDQQQQRSESELAELRQKARENFLKEFNITASEPLDVTDLYYRNRSLTDESQSMRSSLSKMEDEIKRMREHIEQEPARISAAVAAAKVHVANNIEQGGKR